MMAGPRSRNASLTQLANDERAAWAEYLADTRNQISTRYDEIEPWAWARLGARLKAIHTRRTKLEAA